METIQHLAKREREITQKLEALITVKGERLAEYKWILHFFFSNAKTPKIKTCIIVLSLKN